MTDPRPPYSRPISLRLPADLLARLDATATVLTTSRSDLVRDVLTAALPAPDVIHDP